MVYTGKPSRGCGMCKSRRIKVSDENMFGDFSLSADIYTQRSASFTHLILTYDSAMKRDQHAGIVRSQGVNVRDTRMNLIWCSEMRTKPWLARRRRLPDLYRPEAVPVAQARMHHHICK